MNCEIKDQKPSPLHKPYAVGVYVYFMSSYSRLNRCGKDFERGMGEGEKERVKESKSQREREKEQESVRGKEGWKKE